MSEARQRADWERASSLLALTFNVNRDPKKTRAATPADFNPFAEAKSMRRGIPLTTDNIGVLKCFVKKGSS